MQRAARFPMLFPDARRGAGRSARLRPGAAGLLALLLLAGLVRPARASSGSSFGSSGLSSGSFSGGLFSGGLFSGGSSSGYRHAAYARAERLREALEGRPEQQRTRGEYERVLDAYRAIYHGDPASAWADASIAAVADLLAEEGRVFHDETRLRDAIGQYDFLRSQYPGSRYRASALLTEGEIYQKDLGEMPQARAIYLEFLREYPRSALAQEARVELRATRRGETAGMREAPARARAQTPVSHAAEARNQDQARSQYQAQNRAAAPPEPTAPAREPSARRPDRTAAGEPGVTASLPSSGAAGSGSGISSGSASGPAPDSAASPVSMRQGPLPLITGIRHWSTPVYTRVAIDLEQEVRYTAARVPDPDRIYFDLYGTRLSPELEGRSVEVTDGGFLTRIRAAQFGNGVTRIVLDVNSVSEYSAFFLANPPRLIIDVHGRKGAPPVRVAENAAPRPMAGAAASAAETPAPNQTRYPNPARSPVQRAAGGQAPAARTQTAQTATEPRPESQTGSGQTGSGQTRSSQPRRGVQAGVFEAAEPSSLADVATLSSRPDQVRATRQPTTAPIASSVAGTTPAPQPLTQRGAYSVERTEGAAETQPAATQTRRTVRRRRAADDVPPAETGAAGIPAAGSAPSSMVRALGLKINRIVIDPGHGGHDSGTLGPGGIEEKDVVLDVALRLGRLLKQRLGADVIYTRSDDTFIPLETRTAIANQAQADLFISIHANSSSDPQTRGVEVYYLNFTTSADALEVAARENSVSDESIHQLSDLVKKIALEDKIDESKAFAYDVDQSLYEGLDQGNPGLKDRGVKKAPFVVLIGANMPSILAEISFLTNPDAADELRRPAYRERIAEALYRGVARYVGSLNGVRIAQTGTRAAGSQ